MPFHLILVPTDFSVYAEDAFQRALVLARREQAHMLLVHVLPTFEALGMVMLSPLRHEL